MSEKKYVPEGVWLVCDKGTIPSSLTATFHEEVTIYGDNLATTADKTFNVNFKPFGACACNQGKPCVAQVTDWSSFADGVFIGDNPPLLEDAELPCALGGKVKIFFTSTAAFAAVPNGEVQERDFWDKTLDFGKGLGSGLWKGLKGTVTGVVDLAVWAGKHTTPYMLMNPGGYQEQLQKDAATAQSLGNLAIKGATWTYKHSGYYMITNPSGYLEQVQKDQVMVNNLMTKAEGMSAEEWGSFTGQVVFEVALEVGTAGAAAALTAVKVADRTVDAARVLENIEDLADATKAIENVEDALPPVPEQLGDVVNSTENILDPPGTFRDGNGRLRNDDGTFAEDPNRIDNLDDTMPYANHRPSYANGQVDEVWENAKSPDGNVYDPNTGDIIEWDITKPRNGQWDMGHIDGQRYQDVHRQYLDGDLTRQEFLDWYQNPDNYVPEIPSNNRSNKFN